MDGAAELLGAGIALLCFRRDSLGSDHQDKILGSSNLYEG
jgi:hypothetical protein